MPMPTANTASAAPMIFLPCCSQKTSGSNCFSSSSDVFEMFATMSFPKSWGILDKTRQKASLECGGASFSNPQSLVARQAGRQDLALVVENHFRHNKQTLAHVAPRQRRPKPQIAVPQ